MDSLLSVSKKNLNLIDYFINYYYNKTVRIYNCVILVFITSQTLTVKHNNDVDLVRYNRMVKLGKSQGGSQ